MSASQPQHDGAYFVVRSFGWSMLLVLLVWMISNILNISFGWPGATALFRGNKPDQIMLSIIQLTAYASAVGVAIILVQSSRQMSLREDAHRISEFNALIVRSASFAVIFVGLGDLVISFLRVEGLLVFVVGDDLSGDLGRSNFRGTWVHVPLIILGILVGLRSKSLGFHWLALLIVLAELAIVLTRFIFSYEQAFMGDLVRFWYAALFLFSSAYTLLHEGHVRVDVFYAGMRNKTKGFVNTVGTLVLGITLCWTILIVSLGGKRAIVYGAVSNFETSQSGFGLYIKYLMAAYLVIFAITMLIQFVSYLMESVADFRGEDGTRLN